jgi:hypothetical protein
MQLHRANGEADRQAERDPTEPRFQIGHRSITAHRQIRHLFHSLGVRLQEPSCYA